MNHVVPQLSPSDRGSSALAFAVLSNQLSPRKSNKYSTCVGETPTRTAHTTLEYRVAQSPINPEPEINSSLQQAPKMPPSQNGGSQHDEGGSSQPFTAASSDR